MNLHDALRLDGKVALATGGFQCGGWAIVLSPLIR
jgi:hypothetical protein